MKPTTDRPEILFLENNALDRAVLDLHIRDDAFLLRFSEKGRTFSYGEEFFEKVVADRRSDRTIVLVDLGLGDQAERVLRDSAQRAKLRDFRLAQFLADCPADCSFDGFLGRLKELDADIEGFIAKIEGLNAIARIRFTNRLMLCGIVSHFAGNDIKEALVAFCSLRADDWAFAEDEADKLQLVFNKAKLPGITERLAQTWAAWRRYQGEYDVVTPLRKCPVRCPGRTQTALLGEVLARLGHRNFPTPDEHQQPMIFMDCMEFARGRGATGVLHRLFGRAFSTGHCRLILSEKHLDDPDAYFVLIPSNTAGPSDVIREHSRFLAAYKRIVPKQCVIFIFGHRRTVEDALQQVFGEANPPFVYAIPDFAELTELPDSRPALSFLRAVVAAAQARLECDHGVRPSLPYSALRLMELYRKTTYKDQKCITHVRTFPVLLRTVTDILFQGRDEQSTEEYLLDTLKKQHNHKLTDGHDEMMGNL